MRIKQLLSRLTGFSSPMLGLSWTPSETERTVARRILTALEDRRVLYARFEFEQPEHCVQSVLELRGILTAELVNVREGTRLSDALRDLRAACRKFLDAIPPGIEQPGRQRDLPRMSLFSCALGELRGVFGLHLAQIVAVHGLEVEKGLATIMPLDPKDDDEKPEPVMKSETIDQDPRAKPVLLNTDRMLALAVHDLSGTFGHIRAMARHAGRERMTRGAAREIEVAAIQGARFLMNLQILARDGSPDSIRPQTAQDVIHETQETVNLFQDPAADPELELTTHVNDERSLREYRLDTRVVNLALANVIDNAIKYSLPRTRILLHLFLPADGSISFEVKNRSAIAPPTDGKFVLGCRGEGPVYNPAGLGVGLWAANQVVQWHKGSLSVQTASDLTVVRIHIPAPSAREGD